ncbi:MAG: CCA tRNA nucleotidyltransferase [Micavibrio sp.]
MKSIRKIDPPLWMTSPAVRVVYQALNTESSPQALFVGGAVRNMLRNEVAGDIDMATIHLPQEVQKRLEAIGVKVIPTGIDHGTVTAVNQGQVIEITTLRRDVSTDGRRAVVAYTDDWQEDARRRDFTINTLLADIDGHIYDPLGEGLNDFVQGHVRFVGDARARIAEDYLRILRYFRFQGLYGLGLPGAATLAACAEAAPQMAYLSRERITHEMIKIAAFDNAADTISLMRAHGILKGITSPAFDEDLLREFCKRQIEQNQVDVVARLSILLAFDIKRAEERWALSTEQKRFIISMQRAAVLLEEPTAHKVHCSLYDEGLTVTVQALLLVFSKARLGKEQEQPLIHEAMHWSVPAFPLQGHDVMALGVKQGPVLGKLLAEVEAWWRASDFVPERTLCLQRLEELVSQ